MVAAPRKQIGRRPLHRRRHNRMDFHVCRNGMNAFPLPACSIPYVGCDDSCVFFVNETKRFLGQSGAELLVRALPSYKSRVVARILPGEVVVELSGLLGCPHDPPPTWERIATFTNGWGWVRVVDVFDWIDDDGEKIKESAMKGKSLWHSGYRPPNGLRVASWCFRGGSHRYDLGILERILKGHHMDVALLQCLGCDQAVRLAKGLRNRGKFKADIGSCGGDGKTVMTVWRHQRVAMVGARRTGLRFGVPTLIHRGRFGRDAVVVGNVGWPEALQDKAGELEHMVEYLKVLKKRFPAGALVGGQWPMAGRKRGPVSYRNVWILAPKLTAAGMGIVPTVYACSGYNSSGMQQLSNFFVRWGKVAGVGVESYARSWGRCAVTRCCGRAGLPESEILKLADISGENCPMVLTVPKSGTQARSGGTGTRRAHR